MKTKKQILLLIVLSIILILSILNFAKHFYYYQVENIFEHKASKWVNKEQDIKLEFIYNDVLDTVSITGNFRGKSIAYTQEDYFIDIVTNEPLFKIYTYYNWPNKLTISVYELDNKTRVPDETIVLRREK